MKPRGKKTKSQWPGLLAIARRPGLDMIDPKTRCSLRKLRALMVKGLDQPQECTLIFQGKNGSIVRQCFRDGTFIDKELKGGNDVSSG
jgi:hypothetical protein